jgi:Tfp pilus assembly protein PilF
MKKLKKKNLQQKPRDLRPSEKESRPKPFLSGRTFHGLPHGNVYAAIMLIFLVVFTYMPLHKAGFVWDDVVMTEAKQLHSINGLKQIWFEPRSLENEIHYWPIVYTTFWIEYQFWKLSALGYHMVNVLLHALNTILLFFLLRRLGIAGAWFASAVFGIHPVHVESVAWVIERKDTLSAAFYIAAFLAYLKFERRQKQAFYALALFFFICGMLSKSMVVTFPLALLLCFWWKRGRITAIDIKRIAPFFIIAALIASMDTRFAKSQEQISFGFSILERVFIATRALCFYAYKLIWPSDLAVIYPRWQININSGFQYLFPIFIILLVGAFWFWRKTLGKGPLAGILYFTITLSPVLGFIDFGYMRYAFVADRFQYLASIGLIVLVSALAARLNDRLPRTYSALAVTSGILVLGLLANLTWRQAAIYHDGETFYRHIVTLNPAAKNAYFSLGNQLRDRGKLEEALDCYQKTLDLGEDSAALQNNMAITLEALGRLEEASVHYENTLKLEPQHTKALHNLAGLRFKQKRYEEALQLYQKAFEIDSSYAKAHQGAGNVLAHMGRYKEAVAEYEKALEIDPNLQKSRHNLNIVKEKLLGRGNSQPYP